MVRVSKFRRGRTIQAKRCTESRAGKPARVIRLIELPCAPRLRKRRPGSSQVRQRPLSWRSSCSSWRLHFCCPS